MSSARRHTDEDQYDLKVCGQYVAAVVNGDRKALNDVMAKSRKRNPEYYKQIDRIEQKTLSEGTGSEGGHAVPTEFNRQIVRRLVRIPAIHNRVRQIPMISDKMEIPSETGSVTVAWTAEDNDIAPSDPTFGQVVLTAYTVAGLTRMSNRLLAHYAATPDLMSLLLDQFSQAISEALDNAIVSGAGGTQPTGLQSEVKSAGGFELIKGADALATNITLENLVKTRQKIVPQIRSRCIWIMHPDTWDEILTMKDSTSGAYLFLGNKLQGAAGVDGMVDDRMLSNDVYTNSSVSKILTIAGITNAKAGYILFGDPESYFLGNPPRGFEVATSQHEGDNFKKDRSSVRVLREAAGNIARKSGWKANVIRATA